MHYTELQIIDKMKHCIRSDRSIILNYLTQLPDWRALVFPRHKKFIIALICGETYMDISKKYGYSLEGIENIFRKIQVCLKAELDWEKEQASKAIVKKERTRTDKDNLLRSSFNYLRSLEDINTSNISNPIRKSILNMALNGQPLEKIEKALGVDANSIYHYLFTSESDSIYIDIKGL